MKGRQITESIVLPEVTSGSRSVIFRTVGIFLRAFLAFLFAYGMSSFVFDSMMLSLPCGTAIIVCAVLTAIMWLMSLSRRLFAAGAVMIAAAWAWYVSMIRDIADAGYLLFASAAEAAADRLRQCGYTVSWSFDRANILEGLSLSEYDVTVICAIAVMTVICAVTVCLTVKRARPVPLVIFAAAVSAPIHFFYMCEDSFGFSLMIVALCAVIAMGTYDRVFTDKKRVSKLLATDKRSFDSKRELCYTLTRSSSAGGFVGGVTALAAALIMILPFGVTAEMPDVPEFTAVVRSVQELAGNIFKGGRNSPSGTFFVQSGTDDDRDTAFSKRSFTGEAVFDLQTDVNAPVYLRAWSGIDYKGDSWHTASDTRINTYRQTFGTGFTPELLTYEFLRMIDPELVRAPENGLPVSHAEFGYISTGVHIKKLKNTGNTVFLPSYTDQRRRLLYYGRDRSHFASYSNYFEGIGTSNTIGFTDAYSVSAHITLPQTEESVENIALLVYYYSNQYELIGRMREILSHGGIEDDVRLVYKLRMENYDPVYPDGTYDKDTDTLTTKDGRYSFPTGENSLAYRYAYTMTEEERLRVHAVMDNLPIYYDFVYNNYLTACENSAKFKDLVLEITDSADSSELRRNAATFDGRHEIVTAVIDYLSREMTYTLDPRDPSDYRKYVNSAETFLFDTKEGYCVQYATSAVMLLRAAGIPARYSDGYVAADFKKTESANAAGKYQTTVRDKHAHAWVEVYYDYYGWVVYEATQPYVTDAPPVIPDDSAHTGDVTTAPDTDADTSAPALTRPIDTDAHITANDTYRPHTSSAQTHPNTGDITPTKPGIHIPASVIIAAVAVAAAAVSAIIFAARVKRANMRVREIITGIADIAGDPKRCLERAAELNDIIMALLRYYGLTPNGGELFEDFAERVDGALDGMPVPFAEVCKAMLECEFSDSITHERLCIIGGFAEELLRRCEKCGGRLPKIKLKYFIFKYC